MRLFYPLKIMALDPKRAARQEKSFQLWKKNKAIGTVIYPTGGGKTRIALIAIEALNKASLDYTIIVIVPSQSLQEQWIELLQINKLQSCKVFVVNTIALKDVEYKCHLLICDEIHRLCKSEKFPRVFNLVKSFWRLGLSATVDESDFPVLNKYCPVVDEMFIDEALNNQYISEYKIYNLGIEMGWKDTAKIDKWKQDYFAAINMFGDYDNYRKFLSSPSFRDKLADDVGVHIGELYGCARRVTKVVTERKQFFYNHPWKIETVKEILEKFPTKKAITFSLSIEFMKQLEDKTSICCHSGMKKKEAKLALEKFTHNKDQIRCIHSGKKLLEGIDISGLELGIRCSYTSSKVDYKQARGRVIRKEGDKEALFFNLYMKDPRGFTSVEEGWLKKSMEGDDLNVEWIDSLEDIL